MPPEPSRALSAAKALLNACAQLRTLVCWPLCMLLNLSSGPILAVHWLLTSANKRTWSLPWQRELAIAHCTRLSAPLT